MKTIWKFVLSIDDEFTIDLPIGSKSLTVQMQNNRPCLWVLVPDTNVDKIPRKFVVLGTGNPIEHDLKRLNYIGTFQSGEYVWHLFEHRAGGMTLS